MILCNFHFLNSLQGRQGSKLLSWQSSLFIDPFKSFLKKVLFSQWLSEYREWDSCFQQSWGCYLASQPRTQVHLAEIRLAFQNGFQFWHRHDIKIIWSWLSHAMKTDGLILNTLKGGERSKWKLFQSSENSFSFIEMLLPNLKPKSYNPNTKIIKMDSTSKAWKLTRRETIFT